MKKYYFSIASRFCVFCFLLVSFLSFQSTAYSAASDYYDTVQKIYIGYYQRPADPAGLIWWAEELSKSGGNLTAIIEAFANSEESRALYGTIDSSNIATVVNDIYYTLFARNAEIEGRDWYVAEFNKGNFTAATIMLNVLYGAQGTDLQSVNNKLAASNLFTWIIDPELDGSSFQVTYAGNADAVAGRNFLSLYASAAKIPLPIEAAVYMRAHIADTGDALLTRINAGSPQWARTVSTGSNGTNFNVIATGIDGSVYASGYIKGTSEVDFGNTVKAKGTYGNGYSALLVKYDRSGTAQWARTVTTGTGYSGFNSITVALDGSVYAAGTLVSTGTYDFGNSVTAQGIYKETDTTGYNAVLVKYGSDGTPQWARTVTTGSSQSFFGSVVIGSDGFVYCAGFINGTGVFGFGNAVTAQGTADGDNALLVKYSPDGMPQWAKSATTGTNATDYYRLTAGPDALYAVGFLKGTGTSTFSASGAATAVSVLGANSNHNGLIVKYAIDGTAQWANTITSGSADSYYYHVAVGLDGHAYVAGNIGGTGSYGFGNAVTAQAQSTVYSALMIKYDSSSGTAQWAKTTTGAYPSGFVTIAAGLDGYLYAAGGTYSTGTVGFGNAVTAAGSSSANTNLLLLKYDTGGNAQWAKSVPSGSSGSFLNGVAFGIGGDVLAAGYITATGTYNLGNAVTVHGSSSQENILVVRCK